MSNVRNDIEKLKQDLLAIIPEKSFQSILWIKDSQNIVNDLILKEKDPAIRNRYMKQRPILIILLDRYRPLVNEKLKQNLFKGFRPNTKRP